MSKRIVLFLLLVGSPFWGMTQTILHCGQEEYMNYLSHTNPGLHKQLIDFQNHLNTHIQQQQGLSGGNLRTTSTNTIITIPVVVHVIHNNAAGTIGGSNNTNISNAQVFSQIDVLNKDYQRLNIDTVNTPTAFKPVAANVQLAFCMATMDPDGNVTNGITRTYSSQASFSISDETALKSLSYWPSDQYLNIWVCNLTGPTPTQTLLGYTQPPGGGLQGLSASDGNALTDGVVINYKAFGTTGTLYTQFSLGRTATHEVGHWFGLLHPWGNYNSGDCSLSDYCNDTPTCANPFEASAPACTDNPPITCGSTRMIQNYMEYSDDGCMNLFTNDQSTRMHSSLVLSPRRQAILSSLGCCTIKDGIVNAPYSKSFEDGDLLSDGWVADNANSSSVYTKGFELAHLSGYGIGSFATSVANDSVYVNSDSAKQKYHYSYISPYMNLQQTSQPILHFDWAYSPRTAGGNTDSVVVYVTSGCSELWQPLQTFYGSTFSSTSTPRPFFSPNSNEWSTSEIDMSAYTTKPAIRIKFVSYSKGINTFYLDNIDFSNSAAHLQVNCYPNPTSGILNVASTFTEKKNIHYMVYNVLGQSMYQTEDMNVYSSTKQLDLSFLASGVYFILVSDGDDKVVKRIVKQ